MEISVTVLKLDAGSDDKHAVKLVCLAKNQTKHKF